MILTITIDGSEKEIAAFVLAVQRQQQPFNIAEAVATGINSALAIDGTASE